MFGRVPDAEDRLVKARAGRDKACSLGIVRSFAQNRSFGWVASQFVRPGMRNESSFCTLAQFNEVSGERAAPWYSLSVVATIFGFNCGQREARSSPICQRERGDSIPVRAGCWPVEQAGWILAAKPGFKLREFGAGTRTLIRTYLGESPEIVGRYVLLKDSTI